MKTLPFFEVCDVFVPDIVVGPGSYISVNASVVFKTPELFENSDAHPVYLSYHWRNLTGDAIVWDGVRSLILEKKINVMVANSMLVKAPCSSGQYVLEVTLIKEGLFWVETQGGVSMSVPVCVQSDDAIEGHCANLLIAGGSGFENAGDEALLLATVRECEKIRKRVAITLAVNNYPVTGRTIAGANIRMVSSLRMAFFRSDIHYGACDDEFIRRWHLVDELFKNKQSDVFEKIASGEEFDFIDRAEAAGFVSVLLKTDKIIIHGGGILTSATRSRLWEFALLCRIAKRLGIPVALKGHQLGPFSIEDKHLAKEMLDSATFVSTRDKNVSLNFAREAGSVREIHQEIDDAFKLTPEKRLEKSVLQRIGLIPREYICLCYRSNSKVGVTDECLSFFKQILNIIPLYTNFPIVLLPMGPFDLPSLVDLHQCNLKNTRVIHPVDWLWDPIIISRGAHLMVSLPHHPLIFSLQARVPVISPVEGDYYVSKNVGSMRWFGMDDYVIDVSLPSALADFVNRFNYLLNNNKAVGRFIDKKIKRSQRDNKSVLRVFSQFHNVAPLRQR